jgi:hypothetical protein
MLYTYRKMDLSRLWRKDGSGRRDGKSFGGNGYREALRLVIHHCLTVSWKETVWVASIEVSVPAITKL